MSDIVIIALLGILANANTWNEIHYFAVSHEKWSKESKYTKKNSAKYNQISSMFL